MIDYLIYIAIMIHLIMKICSILLSNNNPCSCNSQMRMRVKPRVFCLVEDV